VRAPLAALAFLALLVQPAYAAAGREVTLVLPHALRAGETAWLKVRVGAIARGEEIEIETTEGRLVGVISPFGIRSGHEAGTYTIPLPAAAISDDRVSLRLSLDLYGHEPRAPTAEEVKSVSVKIVRVKESGRKSRD
jgi:hypothetical protein